jgi:hypothetical protein
LDTIALPPDPGTYAACKLRIDAIMRTLADRHAAKVEARSGFATLADFVAARRGGRGGGAARGGAALRAGPRLAAGRWAGLSRPGRTLADATAPRRASRRQS